MYKLNPGRLGSFESENGIAGFFGGPGSPLTGVPAQKKCAGNIYTGNLIRQNDKFVLLSSAGTVPVIPGNPQVGNKLFHHITKSVRICGTHGPNGIVASEVLLFKTF